MHTYADSSKQLQLKQPEELWVNEITYLSTREQTIYLHLESDAILKTDYGIYS